MSDLPELKGVPRSVKWAADVRAEVLQSGKFAPMYLNLIRRVNDADWWILNRHDLALGRFKHPTPGQLEPLSAAVPKPLKQSWWKRIWRMKKHTHVYEKVTCSSTGNPEAAFKAAHELFRDAEKMMKEAEETMRRAEEAFVTSETQHSVEVTTIRLRGKRFRTFLRLVGAAFMALFCNKAEIQVKVKKK